MHQCGDAITPMCNLAILKLTHQHTDSPNCCHLAHPTSARNSSFQSIQDRYPLLEKAVSRVKVELSSLKNLEQQTAIVRVH